MHNHSESTDLQVEDTPHNISDPRSPTLTCDIKLGGIELLQ